MYPSSVEEEIAGPLMAMLKGEDHALHGAGREDIDALMLGRGRPFAVEIRRPRLRSVDFEALERAVRERSNGLVEVSDLRACTQADVAALKDADWRKTYRVLVALEKDIKDDQINRACATLSGSPIDQQTPTRVVHRRADKIRRRVVEGIEVLRRDGPLLELRITGESGLYVKELVNGDGGRTKPSLTELLGVPCSVTELDVIEIHDN
jgi:tRNA pseudouridine synthase 10